MNSADIDYASLSHFLRPYLHESNASHSVEKIGQRARLQIEICEKYLKLWADDEIGDGANPSLRLAAIAYVRNQMGRALIDARRYDEAKIQYEIALDEASRAPSRDVMHSVLVSLGVGLTMGDLDVDRTCDHHAAAGYFGKSVLRATGVWPHNIESSLNWLAIAWAGSEDTKLLSLGIRELLVFMEPYSIGPLIGRAENLIRIGHLDQVKSEAQKVKSKDLVEVAKATAAAYVMKQKKRAIRAAESGLDLAKSQNEEEWREAFESFLKRYWVSKSEPT